MPKSELSSDKTGLELSQYHSESQNQDMYKYLQSMLYKLMLLDLLFIHLNNIQLIIYFFVQFYLTIKAGTTKINGISDPRIRPRSKKLILLAIATTVFRILPNGKSSDQRYR